MTYWGVRLGKGGQYADLARELGFIAVGWEELGDLSWLAQATDEGDARGKLHEMFATTYAQTGMKASIAEGQLWRFVREIRADDVILVPHVTRAVVHVGSVAGGAEYVATPPDGCPYRLRRKVTWVRDIPRTVLTGKLRSSLNSMLTVFSLANRTAEIRAALGEKDSVLPDAPKRIELVKYVIDRLHGMHPQDFESFVASYFRAIGYDAEPTQYVGDGGIDVVGTLDAEGLAKIDLRVQVKRTQSSVGIDTVLKTRGALAVDEQGAIVSLGGFTAQARAEAEADGKKTIVLVEGDTFVELLLDHWHDLDEAARRLLGVRPKEELPVRDRFEVDVAASA
jgi:restriction system protein